MSDPVIRTYAERIQASRDANEAETEMRLNTPEPADIDALRLQIQALFGDSEQAL